MINAIIAVVGGRLLEKNTQCGGEFHEFRKRSGDAEISRAKVVHVSTKNLRRVTFRVDTDKHDARYRACADVLKFEFRVGQYLQRRWANIRAVRKSEEDQIPLAAKRVGCDRFAILVLESEGRQFGRTRNDESRLQLCRFVYACGDKNAGRKRAAEDDRDDEVLGSHVEVVLKRISVGAAILQAVGAAA